MSQNHPNAAAAPGPSFRWDLFRYFLAVSKTASISGGAQMLRESPPTVSRRVKELERLFGVALFARSPQSLSLTPAGERLSAKLSKIDREMHAIHQEIDGYKNALSGTIAITAPRGFGQSVLMDAMRRLRRDLPDVEYLTLFQSRKLSMKKREADIALRIGDPTETDMIARRIGAARFSLYASRSYLEKAGAPEKAEDLRDLDYVGLYEETELPQNAVMKRLLPDLPISLGVDCICVQAQAVVNGLGYAALPRYMAAEHPDLVEVTPGAFSCEAPAWVLYHPDRQSSASMHATLRPLVAESQAALAK